MVESRTGRLSSWLGSPRIALVALGVGLGALFVVTSLRPLRDFDLPWNLASGRLLARTHEIPHEDRLAFTHGALNYVEVLSDLGFYAIVSVLGERGLAFVGGLSVLATVLFVRARLFGDRTLGWLAASLVAMTASSWFEVRPATLSFPLVALVLFVIDGHRRKPEELRPLVALVPLFFVWANVHGYVALGVAVLAGYAAHRALARLARGRAGALLPRRDGARAGAVAGIALAAAAAASVNTVGPRLLLGPLRLDERFSGISEWARPTREFFLNHEPLAAGVIALGLVAFVLGRERDGSRAPALYDLGLVMLGISGVLSVVRLLPLGLILVVPLAVRRIGARFPPAAGTIVPASLLPLVAAGTLAVRLPLSLHAGFDPTFLPVNAARFAGQHEPVGPLYNFWPFGGYLGWALERPVFMDGRNQLARDVSLLEQAERASTNGGAFETLRRRYGFEWAVTGAREGEVHDVPLASSEDFTLVYLDDLAAVYVRRDGPNRSLADAGYRVLRHLTSYEWVLGNAVQGGELAVALSHDGALAATQAPQSARAAFFDASGGIAVRDRAQFERGRRHLAALRPGHAALGLLDRLARAEGLRR